MMGMNIFINRLTLISFLSTWIIVHTSNQKDLQKNNSTDFSCVKDFSEEMNKCIQGFLLLHHHLGLFSHNRNTRINVIYISIHKEIYCQEYINSLQCIHDTLTGCSTDTTTSHVQHRLGQLWALTANKICHINQKTNLDNNQPVLPNKITELLTKGFDSEQDIEEKRLLSDCDNKEVQEHSEINPDETLDNSGIDLPPEQMEANVSETETKPESVDNLMGNYEPLLKLLVHLLSPAVAAINQEVSDTSNTPRKSDITKKTQLGDTSLQNINVKYETVLLKRLKITNRGKAYREKYSYGPENRGQFKDKSQDERPLNSVVKEFEISTENRSSRNKKSQTTTYQWKTKLKKIL